MNKAEFLTELQKRLAGLPEDDLKKSLEYCGEMIDDRMEDGMSEEEAVAAIGPMEALVEGIVAETPLPKLVTTRVRERRRGRPWLTALAIIGFPAWLPLLIVLFVLIIVLYVVLGAMIAAAYSVFASVAVSAGVYLFSTIPALLSGKPAEAALLFGLGLALAGLAILMLFAANFIVRLLIKLVKKIVLLIKCCFIGRKTNERAAQDEYGELQTTL